MAEKNELTVKPSSTPEVHSEVIKKPILKRFKEAFFVAKPEAFKDAIIDKVLIPTLQDMAANTLYTAVDVLIYHREPSYRRGIGHPGMLGIGGPLNYNRVSEQARFGKTKTGSGYIFRNLSWETIDECNIVWERIVAIYEQYHVVTVHQFYDAAERTADYTDDYYGWTSLDNCGYGIENGRYYLELPEPELLKR